MNINSLGNVNTYCRVLYKLGQQYINQLEICKNMHYYFLQKFISECLGQNSSFRAVYYHVSNQYLPWPKYNGNYQTSEFIRQICNIDA